MQKLLNLPTLVLLAFLVRLLITGASIGESIVCLGLCALYSFHLYLDSKKIPVANKELIDRIVSLEESLQSTREKVSALGMGASMRR